MIEAMFIVLGCLYAAGAVIAAGDAVIDEQHERQQARKATIADVRDGAEARVTAAQRRLALAPIWPFLFARELHRLRDETAPRNRPPRHRTKAHR